MEIKIDVFKKAFASYLVRIGKQVEQAETVEEFEKIRDDEIAPLYFIVNAMISAMETKLENEKGETSEVESDENGETSEVESDETSKETEA